MLRRHHRNLLVFALCALAGIGAALGQTGGLRVRVVEASSGDALPGATVTLSSPQQRVARASAVTDADGRVEFPVLPAGSGYVLEVAFPGFATQRVSGVSVSLNGNTDRVVALSTEVREHVDVRAERAVVDVEQVGNATKFSDEFLENLPTPGRFYQNVLTLAPGLNDADKDGNPNVHGARFRDFKMIVGGISNSDPLTGEWLSFVNTDSIEEMEVIDRGAGVEFGGKSGGFGRILEKQGSNDFEASLSYYYRTSKLDGRGSADLVQSSETQKFEWKQPSLFVSGPIVKDRLWFRLSHERIDRADPFVSQRGLETIGRNQSINSDQLTWQVSPRNKLALQYSSDPLTVTNFGLTSRIPSESTHRLERGGPTWKLTWSAPYSPKLFVESLVAYQDHAVNLVPTDPKATEDCAYFYGFTFGGQSYGFPILNTARCFNTITGLTSGAYPGETRDKRQRFTVQSQATMFLGRFLGATHRLKLGMNVENERYYRELERLSEMTFFTKVLNPFEGPIGFASVNVAAPRRSSGTATGTRWALWLEDQIKPLSGLAITLGLRLDRNEIHTLGLEAFDPTAESQQFLGQLREGILAPYAAQQTFTAFADIANYQQQLTEALGVPPYALSLGPTASESAFWTFSRRPQDVSLALTDLAPRLSIAWDPWQDGKTQFSISAGRYYGDIVLAVPLVEIEPPDAQLLFRLFQDIHTGQYYGYEPAGGFKPTVSVHMLDRNLRTPYQDELTVGFERALWLETSIKAYYIRRKYRDQIQDIDVNHLPADFGRCVRAYGLGEPTVVVADEPGEIYVDPYTGETYQDNTPGPGDGYIAPGFTEPWDDCTGDILNEGGFFGNYFGYPDGLPDLYMQNPGWGDILLVGNFNRSDYTGYVVELVRRMYRNWQLQASYTWSKIEGDAEDFDQLLGNERNLIEDERGFLSYDQRHVAKLSAVTLTRWGVRLGGTVRWESGLPYSALTQKLTVLAIPPEYGNVGDPDQRFRLRYPTGQRNDQRNPGYWTVDLRIARAFHLGRGGDLEVSAEAFNLFGDQTLRVEDRVNGEVATVRRYGRQFQIGLRWSF